MSNCPGDGTLALLLEGTLPPGPRGAVVAHLDTCSQCRGLLADAIAMSARAPSASATAVGPGSATGTALPPTVASATPDLPDTGATVARRYLLGAALGRGGMGVVYEAMQLDLARAVAVKLLRPSADPAAATRFAREARTLAQLSHPNIVQIFDFGIDVGVAFVVMERLHGRNLAEALRTDGRFDVGRAVRIAAEVLVAISVAHAAAVVHRDIKPANVFLAAGNPEQVKLLDFGIAQTNDGSPRLTDTGAVVGTPAYMAPEQILAGTIDPRTDLHAVGACLFEMLTGQRPFPGPSSAEIIGQIVRGSAQRVDALRPDVPTRLADVVERSMARDPNARFADAGAMLEALAPWRTGVASAPALLSAGPSNVATTNPMPLPHVVAATAPMPMPMMQPMPAVQATPAPQQSSSRGWVILLASVLVTVVIGLVVATVAFITLSGNRTAASAGAAPGAGPQPAAVAPPTSVSATSTPTGAATSRGGAGGAGGGAAKDTRVPCVCITANNFQVCQTKLTTCECQGSPAALFPRAQTKDSKDGMAFDAPGKADGQACTGFSRAFKPSGEFISNQESGVLRNCNDCSPQKALAHPVLAVPGTPCSGIAVGAGLPTSGTWKAKP